MFNPTEPYCCEIGCVITDYTDREAGVLLFLTRKTTTASVAIERMRLTSARNLILNNNLNASGVTTVKQH